MNWFDAKMNLSRTYERENACFISQSEAKKRVYLTVDDIQGNGNSDKILPLETALCIFAYKGFEGKKTNVKWPKSIALKTEYSNV